MINKRKLLSLGVPLAAIILLACHRDHDIAISISETDEELVLSATYPNKDSRRVQDYIKSKLKMTNISDFHYLEIKHYTTPDDEMNFHIKSRDGYLKIVLDRRENSSRSVIELKKTAKGLEELLTKE